MQKVIWLPLLEALVLGVALEALADEPFRFPDVRDTPPPNEPRVFQLSQRYPQTKPAPENYPWASLNYASPNEWKQYLRSVLNYAREGNEDVDWDVVKNEGTNKRQWYHAPWMHWGRNGREYIHGLTHERVAVPGDLHPEQKTPVQNWAVSIYNPIGGYTIGQVWRNSDEPDPKAARFEEGAVSLKLLFTAATKEQVPFLKGAKEWDAHIYESIVSPTNPRLGRKKQTVRLVQIDLAVRDKRADSESGWVFGTFVYNGNSPAADFWDRFEPLGVMWGDDEGITANDVRLGKKLKQTHINLDPKVPYQHLGWGGRLNGPVDNPISSCISCHATAQVHATDWTRRPASIIPEKVDPDSKEWMDWFKNVKAGTPFTTSEPGWESTDYSLQLSGGIANFREWKLQEKNLGGVSTAPQAPAAAKIKAAPNVQSRDEKD